jgi:hypothetical protein
MGLSAFIGICWYNYAVFGGDFNKWRAKKGIKLIDLSYGLKK